MSYYFAKKLQRPFNDAVQHVTEALQKAGFGLVSQIDVTDTLRKKLGVEFRNYRILGACKPAVAHEVLGIEDKIGTMLPCNVIVQDAGEGMVEVAAVDPVASMAGVGNPALAEPAGRIRDALKAVVEGL